MGRNQLALFVLGLWNVLKVLVNLSATGFYLLSKVIFYKGHCTESAILALQVVFILKGVVVLA